MFLHYSSRAYFRVYKVFGSCHGDWVCRGWENSVRKYHLNPLRSRNPSLPLHRDVSRKAGRTGDRKNVDRKVYMRDVLKEILNILRYCSWDSAQEQLQRLSIKWDSFTVNQILKAHPPMEKAWLFFNWISKQKGFKHDKYTYTTMLDIFGEARRIDSMKHVFQMMQENGVIIDAVTYTSILHWLSSVGDFDGAVKIWEEMKAKRCHPTVVSYTAYMKVLFDNNRADEATKVYKEMLQLGLSPTCHTYTILMVHLISSGKCKSALEVFSKMQETGAQPDKATCNIMVEQCSKAGEAWAIIQILHYMKENFLTLRYSIYLQAHETLKSAGEDDMLLQQVNPHITVGTKSSLWEQEENESDVNFNINRGLLMTLLRRKNRVGIDHIFAGLAFQNMELDPELVSDIIEANCAHGRIDAALKVLEYSMTLSIHIEQVAYLSLIGILIRSSLFSKILFVVEQMVKLELLESECACSLIYRLGHAREFEIAEKIFQLMPEEIKSTSAYTAFVDACFATGHPDKGVEAFETMRKNGIQGASATYNVLIRGLEKCGRVVEAKVYRREKRYLERIDNVSDTIIMDEKLCNILFGDYMLS